ncbi:hypothetical protein A2331_05990 [Candidatus Falkowbacteria bacterium RIFOXYB2_FULL_34_18]|uniref:Uncharacterized protein n=1 Tax=Candidatus Falkowbacteria bacterium RIFOXYD2_FULL_34_120 TaxID=1798007 RepID=A0A1F5TP99_9BACT|nr:MAG: hypothetical protein A2331_05990 [Candidatus Falkowbacteria bacterium RIFOXYB2_FULL_34_18]OGF29061.1 MAG: hypothetical protein A2500_03405 [Candidatus Falkowbacteria bacterium RIFOXYC12_FULL_34_55]OGF36129.1 MAG: hypothetical protein A2466_03565 [Candidatus Falkowbacteria bacterium RIFOXYC2_FULL_34_220]OGF38581.1 MAG: hypothetical protein A2515_04825 [Candidatus Falkowbacteria bacterium RIFOXYD12_FULL_34_57]OGF40746.1 MAG: hypothetical protein A2531_06930 [Candidatus Falkowbacteria bact
MEVKTEDVKITTKITKDGYVVDIEGKNKFPKGMSGVSYREFKAVFDTAEFLRQEATNPEEITTEEIPSEFMHLRLSGGFHGIDPGLLF